MAKSLVENQYLILKRGCVTEENIALQDASNASKQGSRSASGSMDNSRRQYVLA